MRLPLFQAVLSTLARGQSGIGPGAQSGRVVAMNSDVFKALSVWSCLTGFILAVFYFSALWLEFATPVWLPMLIAIIGGYELYMYFSDLRSRTGAGGGHG